MSRRETEERVEANASSLIAMGAMARTRERARHEIQQSATPTPIRLPTDTTMPRRPHRPIDELMVRNVLFQSEETSAPTLVEPQPPGEAKATPHGRRGRHPWFPRVHVPLAHRKLVESPRIFDGITPSKQLPVRSQNQSPDVSTPRSVVPRVALLSQRSTTIPKRRRTADREFLASLRARNQELYDKLVARFSSSKRVHASVHPATSNDDDGLSGVTTVEDAVLFFLHEKHAHDILYFKRRSDTNGSEHAKTSTGVSMSFGAPARSDDTERYMPYDLERIPETPQQGSSDFFIMSSTALVHHSCGHSNEVFGEAIPITQWVMESKMFALLLAEIPLFQKFLLRKVFVWWSLETRKLIFNDFKTRLTRSLPLARRAFAPPLLSSLEVVRTVQRLRALTLPVKHVSAVQLSSLHDHHREKLSEAETKLIDAKEELLQLMDTMVRDIQLSTIPSTQLDELYSAEATEVHTVNPKWKSAPIRALRCHRKSLANQVETARTDLSLLDKYVRLMEYMFTESVYLMVLGCIRHLTLELRRDDNSGAISASVAIVGDELVVSPSAVDTKNTLLEGIARLIRLAGNFHFTKNAVTWSTNRGSGSLALVSSAFSSDGIASQFELQEVLRLDSEFQAACANLMEEVLNCFDEAARQMKAFESLKPIYAAVQSVSRAETQRNLQLSRTNVQVDSVVELQSVIGISGGELARYMRTLSHRLSVLDRSQHACQKIQSSWKVGFLEVQCRRSVTEILELISQERDMLYKHVVDLSKQGTSECVTAIQKASLVLEDRPQLIEYFCEQLQQVQLIKNRDKQLHQDVRNVDEIVRAMKRYAPELLADGSVQYSMMHTMFTRYGTLTQSHEKFVNKMLPNISQQVSTVLQRYTIRCQRFLRVYEENSNISTDEELERNIVAFQDIIREIKSIEDSTRLYQDYQKMVGMKVIEITMLAEAKSQWDTVQDIVTFTIQWKAATKLMESGIFSDQPWKLHLEKVNLFLSRIDAMLENRSRSFAMKLLTRLRASISDYQRRLEMVIEMAQPHVKAQHWQQILALLGIVNFVFASGVVLSDGSTLTLGFLQSRSLWKYEGHIRDITMKARNDAVTESKLDDMKRRLYAATLPIVKVGEVYELESLGATHLLTQFESDLVIVQTLAQLTSTTELSTSLTQWADEISVFQDILESWVAVQADWKRLVLIFGHHDVQQIVVDATYEFQALDRKWRAMMTAAKGSSSLVVCLREVMSRAFLTTCSLTSEKLWKELGIYLSEKRHFFPRLYFVSDRDLLHIIASSKYPIRLSRLISKCFREIHSLQISCADISPHQREGSRVDGTIDSSGIADTSEIPFESILSDETAVSLYEIVGVTGKFSNDELSIKALRVSSSPEIWMRDFSDRIHDAVKETLGAAIDGPISSLFDDSFDGILKSRSNTAARSLIKPSSATPETWFALPLNTIVLSINILLTSELASLVHTTRVDSAWVNFWDGYHAKLDNLVSFIRRRDVTPHERHVASTIVIVLLNKRSGIEDLYREEISHPVSSVHATHHHHHDTTAIHYNYSNGWSFNWTKMMRYFFEPSEKKCVIHQCVKSHEYGNSFIGGYKCPVMTPLSDRIILAMNAALCLEVGAILYSPTTQSVGKRTLLRELATSIGNELMSFSLGSAVMLSQFYRLLYGALQSESCWVALLGIESRSDMDPVRIISAEMSRVRDGVRRGQDKVSIDGVSVNIASGKVGIFFCAAPSLRHDSDHHELLLRMSHALMPIVCHQPDEARMMQVILSSSGMKEASTLSRKLAALLGRLRQSPQSVLSAPLSMHQIMRIVNLAALKHNRNQWKSEELCVVKALWEELGTIVVPEQRVAVVKIMRSVFATARDLEVSPLGLLATRVNKTHQELLDKVDAGDAEGELAYDSDEDEKRRELHKFRDAARLAMETTYHFVPSDLYLRKLSDLYQVVSRNVMTVLVGQSGSGKTTALDILSCLIMGHKSLHQMGTPSPPRRDGLDSSDAVVSSCPKPARLHPSAFAFRDIHGYFRDDRSWCDGFITRFIRRHCEDPVHSRSTGSTFSEKAPGIHEQARTRSSYLMPRGVNLSTSHSPWLVLDGATDIAIFEPLKATVDCSPLELKMSQLPNGDQLHLKSDLMRVFCEVGDLAEWCPGTVSRSGVVHFQGDLVTYTMLIKSWVKRHAEEKPMYTRLVCLLGKVARSILPVLLDVSKRHMKSFSEILVAHLVGNYLQLLASFIDHMAPDSSSTPSFASSHAKIVSGYAAVLSLGLCIPARDQLEFHDAVIGLVPEILSEFGQDVFSSRERTVYDVSIAFENQEVKLSLFEAPLPALVEGCMSWNRPGARRRSTFRRLSDGGGARGGLAGLGTSSSLFVPTSRLVGYCAWLKIMLTAKLNVLVVGDSAIGKTRLLDDVLSELAKTGHFDVNALQINSSKRPEDILSLIEGSLPRKMRSVYCPGAAKQALVIAIENLNLETEVQLRSGALSRPCSELIRQVCDAKGSFVRATKEFVEFRDVVIACSFSLSPYGYPRLKARLLRHFHLMWMSDHTREILQTVLATFPEQFLTRLPQTTHFQPSDIARLCRYPIETFNAVRRAFKPTPNAPHLLFSISDVLRCLSRLMNVSTKATDDFVDLEYYAVYSTHQFFLSRMTTPEEVAALRTISIATARRLGYSSASTAVVEQPFETMYADYGDKTGCVRITYKAATALFIAADERFQLYNRVVSSESVPSEVHQVGSPRAPVAPVSPISVSSSPLMRKSSNMASTLSSKPATTDLEEVQRPSNELMVDDAASGSVPRDSGTVIEPRGGSLHMPASTRRQPQIKQSTAPSPAAIQNMLDVLSFLQSGSRHLLFCGAEPSKRRSATVIACGAQALHFREVTSQLRLMEFVDQLKAPIMDAGLRASHTLVYVECDSLTTEELEVLIHVMQHFDLPSQLYSSSDKAKILAQEHHMRTFQQSHLRRPSVSSFFDDLAAVSPTRDGVIPSSDSRRAGSQEPQQAVTGVQKKSMYRDNLQRCLYVVMSFGKSANMFELIAGYPTIYYQASVKTFRRFDQESLEAVYDETLGPIASLSETLTRVAVSADCVHNLRGLTVAIHEDATRFLVSSSKLPASEEVAHRFRAASSRFEGFLSNLRSVFQYQIAKMTWKQDLLMRGLHLIEQDREEASQQLAKSADGRLQLVEAGRAVLESSQKLEECETMDRDARRAFVLDEQSCSTLHSEVERERELIQNELDKILPDIAKATDALSQINKYHITEMKSFVNPPQLVRLAMQAVCVLLGVPPTWTEALRVLADIHFLDRLRNFDKNRLDASLIDRVKMYINHPDFSMENMKRASIASTTLCKWVLTLVRYFEVMKRVAPTQKKLLQTEQQFCEIDEMVRAERQKLVNLELRLNDLRVEHARNVQREQELQRLYESKRKWKAEVVHFQNVVNQWAIVLRKRVSRVKDQLFRLAGDTAVVAAMCTYTSSIPHELRQHTIAKWRELALQYLKGRPSRTSQAVASVSMPHMHSFLKGWFVDAGVLKEEFKRAILAIELGGDVTLIMNMLLMDQMQTVCGKFPILIDPLGRATAWVKQRYNATQRNPIPSYHSADHDTEVRGPETGSIHGNDLNRPRHAAAFNLMQQYSIYVIDACDPKATELVEKRISNKTPLLILVDHVTECEEPAFHALLDVAGLATKKGGHTVIFAASDLDSVLAWKPMVWNQLGVIDCTPTASELEEQILSRFLRHHWPSLEHDYAVACDQYVAERIKEEQVIEGLAECLQSISEERGTASPAYPRSNLPDDTDDNVLSDGNGLQEHEMSQITRCLDEYLNVKQKRQSAKRIALGLRARRCQYVTIAKHLVTFFDVEDQLFQNFPTLQHSFRWSMMTITLCVDECIRNTIAPLTVTAQEGQDVAQTQGSMATMIEQITQQYIVQREGGLPADLHRAYRFLVAIGVAASAEPFVDPAFVRHMMTSSRVKQVLVLCGNGKQPDVTAGGEMGASNSQGDKIRNFCIDFVQDILSQGLDRITYSASGVANVKVEVPTECCPLYTQIVEVFLSEVPASDRRIRLVESLARDMSTNPDTWIEFHRLPRPCIGNQETIEDANHGDLPSMPAWIEQLCILERFFFGVVIFGVTSIDAIDSLVEFYLGQGRESATTTNAVEVARSVSTSRINPLFLQSNPRIQVSSPISSIAQCARVFSVREESISFISMQSEVEVHKLRLLREFHASGAWLIIQDMRLARQVVFNTLRIGLERLQDMVSSSATEVAHDFRIWLLDMVTCDDVTNNYTSFANKTFNRLGVLSRHIYLESPHGFRQCYEAFLREEQVRKLESEMPQQLQQPDVHSQHPLQGSTKYASQRAVPGPSSRKATNQSLLSYSPRLRTDQLWIQVGLWIFHSLFRKQVSLGVPTYTAPKCETLPTRNDTIPLDLFSSQYELERAIRLIQLHQRERTLASTMATVSGLGEPVLAPSASTSEWTVMVELTRIVYAGKAPSPSIMKLIHDLLVVCLALPTQQSSGASNQSSSMSEWEKRVVSLRGLVASRDVPVSSPRLDESTLMPLSLRIKSQNEECRVVLPQPVRPTVLQTCEDQFVELVVAAQSVLQHLTKRLPSRHCLSVGLQRQEYHYRTSVLSAWRQNRRLEQPPATSMLSTTGTGDTAYRVGCPLWERGILDHLLFVELPALESYVQQVWGFIEYLASLKPRNLMTRAAKLMEELGPTLDALRHHLLPPAWRCINPGEQLTMGSVASTGLRRGALYAAPLQIDLWIGWMHKAVEFHRLITNDRRLPEELHLPAFGFPGACLYAVRHTIALERNLSPDSLCLVVSCPIQQQDTVASGFGSRDIFATFQLSGLMLWNARWSCDFHALQESVTISSQTTKALPARQSRLLEPLPTLTIHVIELSPTLDRNPLLYCCPVYRSATSVRHLEEPVMHLLVPTVDRASVLSACGVALVLQDDLDQL